MNTSEDSLNNSRKCSTRTKALVQDTTIGSGSGARLRLRIPRLSSSIYETTLTSPRAPRPTHYAGPPRMGLDTQEF